MKAPDHACPLIEINSTWSESELKFVCKCGYAGHVSELLAIRDDRTLWCPKCRLDEFVWGEKKKPKTKVDNQQSFINP